MAEPERLGEQASAYLDAFRAHQRGVPPSVAEAGWAGIEAGLGDPGLAQAVTETAAGASKAGVLGSIKVFVAVVVVGGGGLIGARAVMRPDPVAQVESAGTRPAALPPSVPPVEASSAPGLDPGPNPSPVAIPDLLRVGPAPRLEPDVPTRARVSKRDALAREVALMREIRGAVSRAEFERALGLLDRHRREFPRGVLVEEHDALEVVCACALGRPDARSRLARFRARYPDSPQTQALLTTCDAGDGSASAATMEH